MIDMNEATQKEPVARTRSVAIAGLWLAVGLGLLAGCAADRPLRTPDVGKAIRADLPPATATRPVAVPSRISDALAEPAPPVVPLLPEPKLDLLVNNALAREVFLAIVTDTRYSMLMHPDVAGTLSVTLRGVTVLETLEAIRDVYGYDFKMEGRRITVYAPTLQTRIFTINYPHVQRVGVSDLRVSAGAMTGAQSASESQNDTSRVSTSSRTDLWSELTIAVCTMIGGSEGACPKSAADTKQSTQTTTNTGSMGNAVIAGGRSVVTSPQAGIMAVRAMPDELRQVGKFLKTAQIAVERQVMLEAKIVTVELRDGYQSGIDWSALKNSGGVTGAIGSIGGGTTSATSDNVLVRGVLKNLPGFTAGAAVLANTSALPAAGGGLFGLAFATSGFQAVLGFLETQGDVQILSSPRIATLNNQKALLKVGTDEYYVTGFTATKDPIITGVPQTFTTTPSISPMFSGIALDVMPQIDEANNITLYVRPSVTSIVEKEKKINLGSGTISVPLASRSVNESDTIVRLQDGNIVAIGGLMQIEFNRQNSGLPGSSNIPFFSALLGNRSSSGRKIELVVLIKPTIIRNAQDWEEQTRRTRAALDDMDATRARVIRIDGTVEDAGSKSLVK